MEARMLSALQIGLKVLERTFSEVDDSGFLNEDVFDVNYLVSRDLEYIGVRIRFSSGVYNMLLDTYDEKLYCKLGRNCESICVDRCLIDKIDSYCRSVYGSIK